MEWSETVDISKFEVSAAPYGGPIGKMQVLWISKKYIITCHPLPPFHFLSELQIKEFFAEICSEFWK